MKYSIFILMLTVLVTGSLQAAETNDNNDAENVYKQYVAAQSEGDNALAMKHILKYKEITRGKNHPETIEAMQLYGKLLSKNLDFREATTVLIEAQERATKTFGPFAGPNYQLYMDIAHTYSKKRRARLRTKLNYFNKALEALRESGQHKSLKYVGALISTVSELMRDGSLEGEYSQTYNDGGNMDNQMDSMSSDISGGGGTDLTEFGIDESYENYYDLAEAYLIEADELAGNLQDKDEYLRSKIAIIMARLKVMETAELASVPSTVEGGISTATEKKNYQREDKRLKDAIAAFSNDVEKNQQFLDLANQARMDIAWMNKDEKNMISMCADKLLDMSAKYSSYRLYDIMEGGRVIAPDLNMRVSKNIFKSLITLPRDRTRSNRKPRKPHFIPVCIDGELMAALINAPTVRIKETTNYEKD